jgi:hypothetical protein
MPTVKETINPNLKLCGLTGEACLCRTCFNCKPMIHKCQQCIRCSTNHRLNSEKADYKPKYRETCDRYQRE